MSTDEMTLSRRALLTTAVVTAVTAPALQASAQSAAKPAFSPLALPFDPKAVPGLSEKLLVSHHDNNYAGAVRRLNAITAQTAALDPTTAPVFSWNGLKREELVAGTR